MKAFLPAILALLVPILAACPARSVPPAASVPGAAGAGLSAGSPSAKALPSASAAFPASLVLSVLYFEDRTNLPDLAWLRKGMVDLLVAELARNPFVVVVQRDRLEEVFREQAFQLSGRVADESVVKVGRMTGATVLVSGSVSQMEGAVRLDAQLLSVEQGAEADRKRRTLLRLAGRLFLAGILLFSGSLYCLALSGIRWLGAITPIGGLCFIAGWGCMAWAASRKD